MTLSVFPRARTIFTETVKEALIQAEPIIHAGLVVPEICQVNMPSKHAGTVQRNKFGTGAVLDASHKGALTPSFTPRTA